jgi:hypothetical protein
MNNALIAAVKDVLEAAKIDAENNSARWSLMIPIEKIAALQTALEDIEANHLTLSVRENWGCMIYSGDGEYDAPAYLIVPDPDGKTIQHQYACVGCMQFEMTGRLEGLPRKIARIFKEGLSCNHWDEEELSRKTGYPVKRVWGEALCELEDGRYVATCNCD